LVVEILAVEEVALEAVLYLASFLLVMALEVESNLVLYLPLLEEFMD